MIAIHQDKGAESKIFRKELNQKKRILQKSWESTVRKRTGLEIEKSVFLQNYAHKPDIIKKAKFQSVYTRDEVTGKRVVIQVTRIYDQEKGERIFEDVEGEGVEAEKEVDGGELILREDQQERAQEDAALAIFADRGQASSSSTIRASDLGESPLAPSSGRRSTQASPQAQASNKDAMAQLGEDSSDDGLSPFERSMVPASSTPGGQRAKAKAKGKSSSTPGGRGVSNSSLKPTAGNASGGGGGGADKNIQELFDDINKEQEVLKLCNKLEEVREETLQSLLSRLGGKKTSLAKRNLKDKSGVTVDQIDEVNTRVVRLQAIMSFHKAAVGFEKKRTRKMAATVTEKLHAMRSAGVTLDLTPTCFGAWGVYGAVFVLSCDQQWTPAANACALPSIQLALGSLANTATQGEVQLKAAVLFLCELVRWHSEQKHSEKSVRGQLCRYAFELKTDPLEPLRNLVVALEVAFFDGDVDPPARQQAC